MRRVSYSYLFQLKTVHGLAGLTPLLLPPLPFLMHYQLLSVNFSCQFVAVESLACIFLAVFRVASRTKLPPHHALALSCCRWPFNLWGNATFAICYLPFCTSMSSFCLAKISWAMARGQPQQQQRRQWLRTSATVAVLQAAASARQVVSKTRQVPFCGSCGNGHGQQQQQQQR